MSVVQEIFPKAEQKYRLIPPDGGWGYFITAALTIMNLVTAVPWVAFGLIFGNFLGSTGDETSGTTTANGVYNTVQSFTGLAASFLLQKYSYRKVGLLGAILFSIGAFAIIFVKDVTQLIIAFGVFEGMGYGLMTPASFSAFNSYFDKRMNLMMGVAQAVMVTGIIACPPLMAYVVETLGFRGTVIILAISSLLNFPSMSLLQPVKWHMKKIAKTDSVNHDYGKLYRVTLLKMFLEASHDTKYKLINGEILNKQKKPFLHKNLEETYLTNASKLSPNSEFIMREDLNLKPRFSVISLGDRATTLVVENDLGYEETKSKSPSTNCIDLSLLKDFKYLNISFGVSLSFTSDFIFISIIPLILSNARFATNDIALLMMVFFGSDVVSRIIISVISAFCTIKNRHVFLVGSILTAIFRIAFVLNNTYIWKLSTLAALGFLRCFIQTPLVLVFSEEYKENFTIAFSLYMAICGVVSIIVGFITSSVKSLTQNDEMVVHVLTGALLIGCISWVMELTWNKIKLRRRHECLIY